MTVKRWNPDSVAPPGVAMFSHVAEAPPGAKVVALAGQVGAGADGSYPESLEEQFEVALDNVVKLAGSVGGSVDSIMKLIVFLTEQPKDGRRIAASYGKVFSGPPPAMTWIYVAGLFRPEVKVEIDATLAVGP
jgi:ribosomal-protein-alanine N-acetyltransferase